MKKAPGAPFKLFSVLFFVKKEIVFAGIIGPDVFDTFVDFTLILNLLQIFDNFQWSSRADSEVDQFVLGCWPWSIFQF